MTVADLAGYVKQYWPTLKARLLAGEYHPQAVRAVEIPKPQGGTRQLGIPTVVDRLIQQALQQQLTLLFDPLFSDYSYGFRPGKSAHQAVELARSHVAAGHRWCVELDLEKFFDRVNHDILMAACSVASKTSECLGSSAATLKLGPCRAVSSANGRGDAARRPALAVAVEYPSG
jgi:retron-type reverse transcriptase